MSDEYDLPEDVDEDYLAEALARFRRREIEESLHYLELALGPDWSGLPDILQKRKP